MVAVEPLSPKREQFIPVRKRELFAALLAAVPASETANASRLYELIVAFIHHEFLRELEVLHDTYHLVDPDQPRTADAEAIEAAYGTVTASLEQVLRSANFVEVDAELTRRAQSEQGRIRTPLRNSSHQFRSIRLFRRGEHRETLDRRSLYGLRKHSETIDVYDEVVLLAAVRPDTAHEPQRRGRRRRKLAARHGSVMIKYFHDIAVADLDALYPGAEIVLSNGDRLSLGLPALIAGIPLAIKLAPALLVLYGVVRFYLGGPPPGAANLAEALVVAGGLLALGGFLGNQWTSFQRRALLHQRELNDMIYFHNVTNNVGIFDHLTHEAEEQDVKETLLAYFTLLGAPAPLTQAELDDRIEAWLKAQFQLDIDFEVDDGLRKLEAYGLLRREGQRLAVRPLAEAFAALDRRWDEFFVPGGPSVTG